MSFQNKVAVVTGGSSGIGYATAKLLAEAGANVVITGRNAAAVQKAAEQLGATGIVSDQVDLTHSDRLVSQVRDTFGGVDILFMNAGVAHFSLVEGASESHFDSIMDSNVKGVYFTVQKFLPIMYDGGSIIFNTSVNAALGVPESSVYAMSKAALLAFNKVLARELAPRKIRTNAISPGPIETPIYGKFGYNEEEVAGFSQILTDRILLKRFGQAEEIAAAVKFLASDEGGFINGTELTVDGGLTVNAVIY